MAHHNPLKIAKKQGGIPLTHLQSHSVTKFYILWMGWD